MAKREISCPICSADFLLSGEEKPGDEVYCSYCGSPCRLTVGSSDEYEVEEDF